MTNKHPIRYTMEPYPSNTHPLVLTRYLYDKSRVLEKLIQTVIHQNVSETLFWVYELYFSGFVEDVLHTAFVIYDQYYKKRYPKLKKFLAKKTKELRDAIINVNSMNIGNTTDIHTTIGTIYYNMTTRIPAMGGQDTDTDTEFVGRNIYANISIEKIKPFMTQTPMQHEIPARQFLKQVCKYSCMTTGDTILPQIEPNMIGMFRDRWEYCASQTPYWQFIFAKYGGRFGVGDGDGGYNRILFDNEEQEEAFYEMYGYEPDEQPISILQGCLGGTVDEK